MNNQRRRVVLTIQPTPHPIRFVLVAPRFEHHDDAAVDVHHGHAAYHYEEHTCPSNWLSDIVRIEVGDDTDPHGFVELTELLDIPDAPAGPRWVCDGCQCGMPVEVGRPKPEQCEDCGARTAELVGRRSGQARETMGELYDRARALEAELAELRRR